MHACIHTCIYIQCIYIYPVYMHTYSKYMHACMHIYIYISSSSSLGSCCVPWLGKGLSIPSPNYPVLCCPLPYRVAPVFVHVVSPPLGWSPLCLFLSYGLQVVIREVHRSSLRRLICPAQDHFIFLTVLIISMTFVLSLTQMLVFLSLYVMLSILLSILVCAAASLFCACLFSVQVSAPYVIAGSTQELYTLAFVVVLVVFLCIWIICHQQCGDLRGIFRLSSHPCSPSLSF